MPIEVRSIKYIDEFGQEFFSLRGSIGDLMTAEVEVDVYWNTGEEEIELVWDSARSRVSRTDGGSFLDDGFNIGDRINATTSGSSSNDKVWLVDLATDEYLNITPETGGGPVDETSTGWTLQGITDIEAMNYYGNLVENDEANNDFISKVDGNTIKYNVEGNSGSTLKAMQAVGVFKSQFIGSASMEGQSVVPFLQIYQFKFRHQFVITPFLLLDQYNTDTNQLVFQNVPYLFDSKSLKYVFRVDAMFENSDANIPHSTEDENSIIDPAISTGDVGWFDELRNGNDALWELTSIAYTGETSTDTLTGLSADEVTLVDIVIDSTNSVIAPVDDGVTPTEVVVHCIQIPEDVSEIEDTQTFMAENYRYAHSRFDVGGTSASDSLFTTYIKAGSSATRISASRLSISARFDVQNPSNTIGDNRRYMIWVTVNPTNESDGSVKRNAVLCDLGSRSVNTDNPALLDFSANPAVFIENDLANEFTDVKAPIEHGIISRKDWTIDTSLGSILTGVTVDIIVRNIAEPTRFFRLEEFIYNLAAEPTVSGVVTPSISINRGYKLQTTDQHNLIKLERKASLDAGDDIGYELKYPFKLRWEDWVDVPDADTAFLFRTQDWYNYYSEAGWEIIHRVLVTVADTDGAETQFIHESDISIQDYDEQQGTIPFTCQIQTFDADTGQDLGGKVSQVANTRMLVTFSGDLTLEAVTGFIGILRLDARDVGGESTIDEISNVPAKLRGPGSAWIGTGTTADDTLVTVIGTTAVTVESILDYTKLPFGDVERKLSAELKKGDIVISSNFLLQEDGDLILQQDGSRIIWDQGA